MNLTIVLLSTIPKTPLYLSEGSGKLIFKLGLEPGTPDSLWTYLL